MFFIINIFEISTFNKLSNITQIGSGKSDYYLFLDPYEVHAHKNLFKNSKVVVSIYGSDISGKLNSKIVKKIEFDEIKGTREVITFHKIS